MVDISESRSNTSCWRQLCTRKFTAILLSLLVLMPSAAVHAEQPPDDAQRIENLNNAIVHKEIDLERFYLQYPLAGGKSPKYRRLRYFLLQVASASCSVAAQARF